LRLKRDGIEMDLKLFETEERWKRGGSDTIFVKKREVEETWK
jgi:hypothetical protein